MPSTPAAASPATSRTPFRRILSSAKPGPPIIPPASKMKTLRRAWVWAHAKRAEESCQAWWPVGEHEIVHLAARSAEWVQARVRGGETPPAQYRCGGRPAWRIDTIVDLLLHDPDWDSRGAALQLMDLEDRMSSWPVDPPDHRRWHHEWILPGFRADAEQPAITYGPKASSLSWWSPVQPHEIAELIADPERLAELRADPRSKTSRTHVRNLAHRFQTDAKRSTAARAADFVQVSGGRAWFLGAVLELGGYIPIHQRIGADGSPLSDRILAPWREQIANAPLAREAIEALDVELRSELRRL